MPSRGVTRGQPLFGDSRVVVVEDGWFTDAEPDLSKRRAGPSDTPTDGSSVSKNQVEGPGIKLNPTQATFSTVCHESTWKGAESFQLLIDERDRRRSGPDRTWHAGDMCAYRVIEIIEGGLAAADAMLHPDPDGGNVESQWAQLRAWVECSWPDHPERRLSEKPPDRFKYYRFRQLCLTTEALREHFDTLTECAIDDAMYAGCLQPGTGTITDPDLTQCVVSDETHIKAPHNNKALKKRDKTATPHTNLDGSPSNAPSHPFIFTLVRTGFENERFPLTCDTGPGEGKTDADVAIDAVKRMRKLRPQAHIGGLIYDMMMRAKQLDRIYDMGIQGITKTARNGDKYARCYLGPHKFTLKDGSKDWHEVEAADGSPHIIVIDGNGQKCRVALERGQLRPRQRAKTDKWTMYMDWIVPDEPVVDEELVGAVVNIQLNSTDEEREADPHQRRTKALRGIPESDPASAKYIGRRQDVESFNQHTKLILPERRSNFYSEKETHFKLAGINQILAVNATLAFSSANAQGPTRPRCSADTSKSHQKKPRP